MNWSNPDLDELMRRYANLLKNNVAASDDQIPILYSKLEKQLEKAKKTIEVWDRIVIKNKRLEQQNKHLQEKINELLGTDFRKKSDINNLKKLILDVRKERDSLKEDIQRWKNLIHNLNDYKEDLKNLKEKIAKINPDDFVEWQKLCKCDFENNGNTHSKSCIIRFKEILGSKK